MTGQWTNRNVQYAITEAIIFPEIK